MSYRTEEVAYVQPAVQPAANVRATQRSTAEYRALDAAHHIHPFSDMGSLNRSGSRVIVKAQGVYLWDSEDNKIIDGMAGLWCVNVGYGRKELADAAYRQMQELPFYNTFFKTTHPPVIELSALLAEPGAGTVQPLLLLQQRIGRQRHRAAHRPSILGDARQALEEGRHLAQKRLSRFDDRWWHAGRHGLHARTDALEGREHRAYRPAVFLR